MNRKILLILAVILQFIVLASFIVRYESLKQTGTTLYIPLRAYDPTDIFRGDYVNISYGLPYSGNIDSYSSQRQYIIPEITGKQIVGIKSLSTIKPDSGIYFQVRDGSMREATQLYLLDTGSGAPIEFLSSFCQTEGKSGDEILYSSGEMTKIQEVQTVRVLTGEDKTNAIAQGWKVAKIVSKGVCSGKYQFRTTTTDRFFVPEGSGAELEKKIREGDMYAEWKIGSNGAAIITKILAKEELPK